MIGERDFTAGIDAVTILPRNTVTAATLGQKIFLALPWQKHTNPITAFSIANLLDRRRMSACLNFGDAFVAHSRNTCADLFLQSDCEWMLTVDDDMVLPGNAKWFNAHTGFELPEKYAGMNVIDRLLSHDKTLIGGLYFGKHKFGKPMYSEGASNPVEEDFSRRAPMDLIKPTKWVATGCMLIHKKVFLAIEKRFPRIARGKEGRGSNFFSSSEDAALDVIDQCRAILARGPLNGEKSLEIYQLLEAAAAEARRQTTLGIGEDVSFCLRAAKSGHQPYVDMGLLLGHVGHQIFGPKTTYRRL